MRDDTDTITAELLGFPSPIRVSLAGLTLAQALRMERAARNITIAKFVRQCPPGAISDPTMQRFEKGEQHNPNMLQALLFCKQFGWTLDQVADLVLRSAAAGPR